MKSRTWFFIPFIVVEIVGYVGRYLNSHQSPNWTITPYVVQSLLLLIAPAFFAASIYMILGRCIVATGHDSLFVIPVKWLTKIFVAGDVISFFAQCAGGGLLSSAKTHSKVTLGQDIIIAGLFIQIAFFGFFVVTAGIFHYRLLECHDCIANSAISVLYTASIFILIRSVFRAIEYITGTTGPIMSTEVYLYVFDAALMFLTMMTFNIFTPKSLVIPCSTPHDIEAADKEMVDSSSEVSNEK
ncbi:RTA-like protein [Penicillium odoratum]|uniref:RTA-like protein n=1 Tax=Penicillium odoratum TaxID=1167516 RepID=UPI002546EC9F|nr:RTA-like protein [Penicillium odoratum]KAJ5758539.1 RTA-like protein [Penicillium odoratum]